MPLKELVQEVDDISNPDVLDLTQKEENHKLSREIFVPISKKTFLNNSCADVLIRKEKKQWTAIKNNKLAFVSLCILIVFLVLSIILPMLSPYDFKTTHLDATNQPPSLTHWFGTDDLGRDVFVRTWVGARTSLCIGTISVLINACIGIVYGSLMGFYGGLLDEVMNRTAEVLYAIPNFLIAILIILVFKPSVMAIIMALSITSWMPMAWMVRNQIIFLKSSNFVLASTAFGAGSVHVMFRHLLPHVFGSIIVIATLNIPQIIFAEATLSFLGLGVPYPTVSLGMMINDSISSWMLYPWRAFFPAACISLTLCTLHLLGDGLRDFVDPKIRGLERGR